jgi:hypothetical protein
VAPLLKSKEIDSFLHTHTKLNVMAVQLQHADRYAPSQVCRGDIGRKISMMWSSSMRGTAWNETFYWEESLVELLSHSLVLESASLPGMKFRFCRQHCSVAADDESWRDEH